MIPLFNLDAGASLVAKFIRMHAWIIIWIKGNDSAHINITILNQ
uniref:Uncharacterized protein n=1 Tax=Rhizophora mucronata TaxID=61149 RepID=A0A2P2PWP6_RHIMU